MVWYSYVFKYFPHFVVIHIVKGFGVANKLPEMLGGLKQSSCTPGVGDGQGGLACYNSWGRKESDTTERLN